MNNSEIRALSIEELEHKIAAEKDALTKLKFAHSISDIENPMRIRASRRLVARLSTILNEKKKAEKVSNNG